MAPPVFPITSVNRAVGLLRHAVRTAPASSPRPPTRFSDPPAEPLLASLEEALVAPMELEVLGEFEADVPTSELLEVISEDELIRSPEAADELADSSPPEAADVPLALAANPSRYPAA